jgi:outer membrane protein assembly factor BamB
MRLAHFLSCAFILLSTASARAADWPEFRGANRNGISKETDFPTTWGPDKNILWKVALPQPGNSSPIVSGGRVFLTCAEDEHGFGRSLYCFDAKDGKQLWVRTVKYDRADPTHARNRYCASTPAADGQCVIVWHGSAGVHCYDYDGNELWSCDLGTFRHIWGYASSPISYGDSIILNCGPGARSFVIALDRKTGRTLWQTDERGGAEDRTPSGAWVGAWDTPVIASVGGKDQILVAQPHHVNAYDPTTGKILWTCGGTGDLAYCDVMVGDGVGFAASGYGGPAIGFKLGGSGDVTDSNRLWRVERNPQRIGTGVVRGPNVFMVSEPALSCIEMATGRELWKHREAGQTFWGSIVCAGDRLYVTSQRGTTYVYAADPEAFRLIASNALEEDSNSTPALSDGRIYLRTFKHLYCVGASR